MADCPRCKSEIGSAKDRGCGWRGRQKPADNSKDYHADAHIQCAHESCNIPAMCKIQTKTGWANLCPKHYDLHFADEAHANLDKYGMAKLPDESKAEHTFRMRQFFLNGVKQLKRAATVRKEQEAA